MSEPPAAVRRMSGASLDTLRNNDGTELHPAALELAQKALQGETDRRSVLRVLAWFGVSVASARGVLARASAPACGGRGGR